ncbi:MAG TPA: hypothetical protein VMH87_07790 [Pseudomonadales bacterium]|nr:hypothetical protein [Pseudomonadales bacterium]
MKTATETPEAKTDVPSAAKPENETIKKIKLIVGKYDNSRMEAARHTQMAQEAEVEEKRLLENASPDDEEQIRKITDLKVRRELLTNKSAQFKEAAERDLADLHAANAMAVESILEQLETMYSDTCYLIAEALENFFYKRPLDALAEAKEVIRNTNFGSVYFALTAYLRTEGFLDKLPIFKAKAILEVFNRVKLLGPFEMMPWTNPPVKSAEFMQDKELEKLLTEDGREELILHKINASNGKMTREVAERTVDNRIEFLKSEQEKREVAKY